MAAMNTTPSTLPPSHPAGDNQYGDLRIRSLWEQHGCQQSILLRLFGDLKPRSISAYECLYHLLLLYFLR